MRVLQTLLMLVTMQAMSWSQGIHIEIPTGDDLKTQLDHIYEHVDLSETETEYLLDHTPILVSPHQLNGSEFNDTNFVDINTFGLLYSQLRGSHTGYGDTLEPPSIYMDKYKSMLLGDTVSLLIAAMSFDRVKLHAVDSNLLSLVGSQLYDVPGRTESPYLTDTLFASTPIKNQYSDSTLVIVLDSTHLFTNLGGGLDSIEADFGDGIGYRVIIQGVAQNITYAGDGTYDWTIRMKGGDGIWHYAHVRIDISGSGNVAPPPPPGYPVSPYNVNLTADKEYPVGSGNFAKGTLNIFSLCEPEELHKPLLVIEGFEEMAGENSYKIMFGLLGFENLLIDPDATVLSAFEEEGYDLIYLDFEQTTNYIQANAFLLEKAIAYINSTKQASGSAEQTVVIGVSLGGVIGKYGLAGMENRSEDHQVSKFFTYDSPLQGANYPIGLQCFFRHLQRITEKVDEFKAAAPRIDELISLLESPMTKALLYLSTEFKYDTIINDGMEHIFTHLVVTSEYHDAFYSEMEALGDLMDIEHIALSNGSGINGPYPEFTFGSEILRVKADDPIEIGLIDGALKADIRAFAQAASGDNVVYDGDFEIDVHFTDLFDIRSKIKAIIPCSGQDNAPGGFANLGLDNVRSLKSDAAAVNITVDVDLKINYFSYIPTSSSIDIEGETNFHQAFSCGDGQCLRCSYSTETTQFFNSNEPHVYFHKRIAQYLAFELTTFELLSPLDDEAYNLGSHDSFQKNANPFFPRSSINVIDFNLDIINGGELLVNTDERLWYIDQVPNPNNLLNEGFDIWIMKERCEDLPTEVHVFNQGSVMKIGDQAVGNISNVYVEDEATLKVSGDGEINVQNYSEVHVMDGGKLIIDSGGKLKSWYEAKIVVHDGGKVIVKNGGILQLMHQSELEVQNGGELIIEDGAIIRLWDGPINDGECNIHVLAYGKLTVLGSFDFSGNGYFRFEKDNIFSHPNEAFVMEGVERDVRFIQLEDQANLNIGEKGLILSHGKIIYDDQSVINVPSDSKIKCDSVLFAGIFPNTEETGLELGRTKFAIFDYCGFIGLETAIKGTDMSYSSANINLSITNSYFIDNFISLDIAESRKLFCQDVQFTAYPSNKKALFLELVENSRLNRVNIIGYPEGALLKDCNYFFMDESTVAACDTGIYSIRANTFFHNGTGITNNIVGVQVEGGQNSGSIVEFSCSALTDNTAVGVDGDFVVLSIDAGAGTVGSPGIIGPNVFYQLGTIRNFDIRYVIAPNGGGGPGSQTINARNNYWGGGPADFYRLCKATGCTHYGDVFLNASPYLTTQPTACLIGGGPGTPGDCDDPINDPNGGLVGSGELFHLGYQDLRNDTTELTGIRMLPIAQIADLERSTLEVECQQQIDIARAISGLPFAGNGGGALINKNGAQANNLSVTSDYLNPIPATEHVYFDYELPARVTIYDMTGVVIKRITVTHNLFDITDLIPGVYVAEFKAIDSKARALDSNIRKFIKK